MAKWTNGDRLLSCNAAYVHPSSLHSLQREVTKPHHYLLIRLLHVARTRKNGWDSSLHLNTALWCSQPQNTTPSSVSPSVFHLEITHPSYRRDPISNRFYCTFWEICVCCSVVYFSRSTGCAACKECAMCILYWTWKMHGDFVVISFLYMYVRDRCDGNCCSVWE